MENFSNNKKIALGSGVLLFISFFLPVFIGLSMFDLVKMASEMGAGFMDMLEPLLIPICGIAAIFCVYKDHYLFAKIAFGIPIALLIYSMLKEGGVGFDGLFEAAGIGFYAMIIGSIAGIVFSKE